MRVCGCVGCVVHMYGDVLVEGTHCMLYMCANIYMVYFHDLDH